MKKLAFLLLLSFGAVTSSLLGQTLAATIFSAIQDQTQWKPVSGIRNYDSKTLTSYRSKEAPIFSEYGFTRLDSQEFQQQASSIEVELYEMADPTAAYGVFTFFRNSAARLLEGIGGLGELHDFKIAFVQHRYYVKITSSSRSPLVQPVLLKMGQIVSQALPKTFAIPPVVSRLPKENLVKQSEVFVLGFRALNQKIYLGDKDLFGLANGAEAVLVDYQFPQDQAKLLLISYPTQQLAKKYLERGYQAYQALNPKESVFFKRDGPQVVLVMGAKSAEVATSLLEKLSYVSMVSWDPKAQPLSVARMMLNIFLYTGIMLAGTLVAGLAFGFLRVLLKRLFPNRLFDRPETMQIIRLNLPHPPK